MEFEEKLVEENPASSENAKGIAASRDEEPKGNISNNIGLLMDVTMNVTVELGRTRMQLAQVLDLQHGSVIELESLAGDPVDILVNDCLVAHGEVVVVDDKFGVRITELISSNNKATA